MAKRPCQPGCANIYLGGRVDQSGIGALAEGNISSDHASIQPCNHHFLPEEQMLEIQEVLSRYVVDHAGG
jgi:hypothetical protein